MAAWVHAECKSINGVAVTVPFQFERPLRRRAPDQGAAGTDARNSASVGHHSRCLPTGSAELSPDRPADASDGEVAAAVAVPDAEKKKARRLVGFGPSTSVSAEGIEPSTYGLRVHCSAS